MDLFRANCTFSFSFNKSLSHGKYGHKFGIALISKQLMYASDTVSTTIVCGVRGDRFDEN